MLSYFRSKTAITVGLIPPLYNTKGYLDKPGSIIFEGALKVGAKFDFANSVTFAVSIQDMAAILEQTQTNGFKILHDPNMGSEQAGQIFKTLSVIEQATNGTWFLTIASFKGKSDPNPQKISVNLSKGEYLVLKQILNHSIPYITGMVFTKPRQVS